MFADFWYLDDGDILCATLRWCSPIDWLWTRLTRNRSRKTSTKKRKSSTTFQIWTALLPDGKSPKSALSVDGARQHDTRGRGGTTTLHRRPTLGRRRCHPGHARTRSAMLGAADRMCPFSTKVWGLSRINHIFRVRGHTILTEGAAATTFHEVGHMSLERLFPGLTADGAQQATLSAGQSGVEER